MRQEDYLLNMSATSSLMNKSTITLNTKKSIDQNKDINDSLNQNNTQNKEITWIANPEETILFL